MKIKHLILVTAITLAISCKDKQSLYGFCDPVFKDFSGATFESSSGNIVVKTNHDGWEISYIRDKNGAVFASEEEWRLIPAKLEYEWLTVERTDKTTLKISVNENETGDERDKIVFISAGNCSVQLPITQKGKTE